MKEGKPHDPARYGVAPALLAAEARIVELEEALDTLHMHGVTAVGGSWMMVPKVEWDQLFSRVHFRKPDQK